MTFSTSITDWSNTTDYQQRLEQYIEGVEGDGLPGMPGVVYVDSVGVPTIGWGFALSGANAAPLFEDYFIQQYLGVKNPGLTLSGKAAAAESDFYNSIRNTLDTWSGGANSSTQLQNALNAILSSRIQLMKDPNTYNANDLALIGTPPSSFAFKSTTDIAKTFEDHIQKTYEDSVTSIFPGVPNSDERIALFSLRYQGKISKPFSTQLKAALSLSDANDARAEAWYTIRYLRPYQKTGDVWRNYTESAMFGLYGSGTTINLDVATAVYRMYSQHAATMISFDKVHLTSSIINKADNSLGSLSSVNDLTTSLKSAGDYLITTYGENQTFNYLNIWVAQSSQVDTVLPVKLF